jgi:hypothetical protein
MNDDVLRRVFSMACFSPKNIARTCRSWRSLYLTEDWVRANPTIKSIPLTCRLLAEEETRLKTDASATHQLLTVIGSSAPIDDQQKQTLEVAYTKLLDRAALFAISESQWMITLWAILSVANKQALCLLLERGIVSTLTYFVQHVAH